MRTWCQPLAVALVSLAVTGVTEAQTTLRYQFKTGESIPFTMDMDQKVSMSIGGMAIDVKVRMVYDVTMNTVKVDGKVAQVKTTIDRVKMTMDGPTGKFTVDSNDKTDPEDAIGKLVAPMIKGMNKLEMTVNVDELGETTNARFSEESAKKIKGLGENKLIGEMFTPESLKGMLAPTMILPRAPMEKGKTWTQKNNETMTYGKVTGETKYTFEGTVEKAGRNLVRITSVPEVKIEPEGNANIKVKVKESKGKGTTLFDNKTGRVVESVTEMNLEMEMELAGMTIPQTVVQTLTYRLKDADKSKE